jgi:hypothetical protein
MDCPAGAVSVTNKRTMDKVIVSAMVAVLASATTVFAGEPEVSNKQPVPPPVPPPTSFFRAG